VEHNPAETGVEALLGFNRGVAGRAFFSSLEIAIVKGIGRAYAKPE